MYFLSFVVLLILIIWAYIYQNWIIIVIGLGLMFFTLLFYTLIKHISVSKIEKLEEGQLEAYVKKELKQGFSLNQIEKTLIKAGHPVKFVKKTIEKVDRETKQQPKKFEIKHEVKKEVPQINKLLEKEKILERIKLKRKIILYLFIFLFSFIPVFLGYQNKHWITLSLGFLLAIVSIFGLFYTLNKLKSMKKQIKPKPQKVEKKVIVKKELKTEKKAHVDKKKKFKKICFIAIIILIIAIINAFIFFLPNVDLWIYISVGAGIVFIFLVVMFISKIKPKEKAIKETMKEVKEKKLEVVDEDVRKVLQITDELLGNLPDDKIAEFSKSPDFELYERVLNKYNIK